MRLQTKSQDPAAAPRPSRTASPGASDRRRRAPAGRPPAARRRGRRCAASSARSRLRSAPGPRSGRPERGTPPIPLTLRGMRGAPHRPARSSARSFFLLPSMLALLALALFPVVAHARMLRAVRDYETRSPERRKPTGDRAKTKPEVDVDQPSQATETHRREGSRFRSRTRNRRTRTGTNRKTKNPNRKRQEKLQAKRRRRQVPSGDGRRRRQAAEGRRQRRQGRRRRSPKAGGDRDTGRPQDSKPAAAVAPPRSCRS